MARRPGSAMWLFPKGTLFPIVSGELHPLKRFSRRLLYRGVIAGVALHVLSFGGWLAARRAAPDPVVLEFTREVSVRDSTFHLDPPPAIERITEALAAIGVAVAREHAAGVPEPVRDYEAQFSSIASAGELAETFNENDFSPTAVENDTIDFERFLPAPEEPAMRAQVFDELPVAIQAPDPIYPDLARSAGVEGTVLVSAQITREGRVGEVRVIEGNWLLRDAAASAVKTWIFRPALHQHQPVQVWVNIPVIFKLD